MNLMLILPALVIATIIMTIYYFSVFSKDKIKNYSNIGYALFLTHLIMVYCIIFIVLYLFIGTIINSKQIYPRSRPKYSSSPNYSRPEYPRFNDLFFNQNFNRLFRRPNRIKPNINSMPGYINMKPEYIYTMKPEYIVGDASAGIPYTEWE